MRKKTSQKKSAKKSASTRAGKYVREEMHDLGGSGKHSPQNRKQAVAIGLSRARKAGVKVPAKAKKAVSQRGAAARRGASQRGAQQTHR